MLIYDKVKSIIERESKSNPYDFKTHVNETCKSCTILILEELLSIRKINLDYFVIVNDEHFLKREQALIFQLEEEIKRLKNE